MSNKHLCRERIVEAVQWNGVKLDIDAAPIWLRKAARLGRETGGVFQSYSDLWVYGSDGIMICNPQDYLIYLDDTEKIYPLRRRLFHELMTRDINEL